MNPRSKIILGTVQFGLDYGINNPNGRTTRLEANAILDRARQFGIYTLDTAASYGTAEQVIGDYVTSLVVNPFSIISKLTYSDKTSVAKLIKSSLKKLNLEYIDVMMLHRFEDLSKYPNILDELLQQKDQGTINKIGVSVYTNPELEQLLDINEIEVIQVPFNMLDNDQQRGEILNEAKRRRKTIHTRSVFLQGLFFKPIEQFPEKLQVLIPYIAQVKQIAQDVAVPMNAIALQYAISRDYIDGVLFGVDSVDQLTQNLSALSIDIDEEIFKAIDEINVNETDLLNPVNWTE